MAMSVQNLWVAQKCAFIGKSAICTWFWSIFFKFIRKTWANRFRRVRVLWAHSGATKWEKHRFLIVFWVLSPRSEPKVLLRPGIGLPAFFWWILKKNGPSKCKNCGFYNKSAFLGHTHTPTNFELTYRIVWKTTRRYIYITRTETRIIHEVLKYLCSDNANFMAIFSHYIPGRVVI